MKPKPTEISPQRDAFLPELADIINALHELVQLAETIDWEQCESELSVLYASKARPGASIRLMVGLTLLKHTYALSDEGVVQRWNQWGSMGSETLIGSRQKQKQDSDDNGSL